MATNVRYVCALFLLALFSNLAHSEENLLAQFYSGPISPDDYKYMNECGRVSADAVNSALAPGESPGSQEYEAGLACSCKSRPSGKGALFTTHFLSIRSRFCRPNGQDPNADLIRKGPEICTNEYIRKFPGRFDHSCVSNVRLTWLGGSCSNPAVTETVLLPAQSTLPPVTPSLVLDRLVYLKFRCRCDQDGIWTLPMPAGGTWPKFEISVCQRAGVTSGDMNVFTDAYCAASCQSFGRNNTIANALPRGSAVPYPELYYSGAECVQATGELTITVDGPGTVTGGSISCNTNCTTRYCEVAVDGKIIKSLPNLTALPTAPANWCHYSGADYQATGPLSFVPKGDTGGLQGEGPNRPTGNHFSFRGDSYTFTLAGDPSASLAASTFTPGISITKTSGVPSASATGTASLGQPVTVSVEINSNSSKIGSLQAPGAYRCEQTGEFRWECTSDTSSIPANSEFKVSVVEKKVQLRLISRNGARGSAAFNGTTCTASSVFGTDCGIVKIYTHITATAGEESFISGTDFKDIPHTVHQSNRQFLSATTDGYGSAELTEIVITFDREEKPEEPTPTPPPEEPTPTPPPEEPTPSPDTSQGTDVKPSTDNFDNLDAIR